MMLYAPASASSRGELRHFTDLILVSWGRQAPHQDAELLVPLSSVEEQKHAERLGQPHQYSFT
jgi:hypothetical protein